MIQEAWRYSCGIAGAELKKSNSMTLWIGQYISDREPQDRHKSAVRQPWSAEVAAGASRDGSAGDHEDEERNDIDEHGPGVEPN